jgi:hypothetical protein
MLKLLRALALAAGYGFRLFVADSVRGRHCESALVDDALLPRWRALCHAAE